MQFPRKLGPLLFLLYINDLLEVIESLLVLFADDSTVVVKGASLMKAAQSIETSLILNSISQKRNL